MEKDKELIQKFLDGELSPEDEKVLLARADSDPSLKEELEAFRSVLELLDSAERLPLDDAFTPELIERLPVPKTSLAKKFKDFFLGQRVLRWNMAAALATVSLVIVITGGIIHTRKQMPISVVSPVYLGRAENVVKMNFYAPQAKMVAVAGDFNKWNVSEGAMTRQAGGIWTLEVPLSPGSYSYMFVLDGKVWVPDPQAESYRDDGFGNRNSVLKVSL